MKILNTKIFCQNLHFKNSFGKIVDYGAKDEDLLYIPILVDEPDSVTLSTSQPPEKTDSSPNTLKKIVKGTGATIAAAEVVPDMISSAFNKLSNVVDSAKDFANKTVDGIADVKENYNTKFKKQEDLQKSDETKIQETNDLPEDPYAHLYGSDKNDHEDLKTQDHHNDFRIEDDMSDYDSNTHDWESLQGEQDF